jgi:hypothetical protein
LAPWFEDITGRARLDFVHDPGPIDRRYFMPQMIGSGAAGFDFDGDGRLDLYLIHNGGPKGKKNQLFHHKSDGTFEEVSAGCGLDVAGYGQGVAVGDINNDGRPDVLLTEYRGVRLFLNEGKGTFKDITARANVNNPHWATSASFLDYDRDGWLDLVVVNYLEYDPSQICKGNDGLGEYCAPRLFPGTVTRLFRNLGGKGGVRFEDRTVASCLATRPGPGLGVACMDFDGDGWVDILVANDGKPNHLWMNQRNGTFKEEAVERGLAFNGMGEAQGNMGIALADVNGDGLLDVLVTHLVEETHTLWLQGPRGMFRDHTVASGLSSARSTGFGTILADFNHDGEQDVVIVNGRVSRGKKATGVAAVPRLDPFWHPYAERNQLLAGVGGGKFRDESASTPALCAWPGMSRGVAVFDLDGDGAMDLLVTTIGGQAHLLRNVAPKRGHWLLVRALDPALKRDAHGAEVSVVAGKKRFVGLVEPGQSYLCSQDTRVHVGLGEVDRIDEIQVRWPDGLREVFPGGKVDRSVELQRGKGVAKP